MFKILKNMHKEKVQVYIPNYVAPYFQVTQLWVILIFFFVIIIILQRASILHSEKLKDIF